MIKKSFLILSLVIFIFSFSQVFSKNDSEYSDFTDNYFEYAQSAMEKWNVPGMAIGIVEKSGRITLKGFGVKDLETGERVDEHTIFQIGSTSKAFTSFLMAKLTEEDKINWDDHVNEYLPDFMMSEEWVTQNLMISDIMAQHSGQYPYAGDYASMLGFSRDEIMEKMRFIDLKANFRKDFTYVNNMFLVAAEIIEIITGLSYEENLKYRIFDELNMTETTADKSVFVDGVNSSSLYSGLYYMDENGEHSSLLKLNPDKNFFNWPYVYAPAGGINSNVTDMTKWLYMHLNGGEYEGNQVIDREFLEYVYRPQTMIVYDFDRSAGYAQGWLNETNNGEILIWHNGSTSGCKTFVGFMPEKEIGIVILSNLGGTELPDLLGRDFFKCYLEGVESTVAFDSYIAPEMTDITQKYVPDTFTKYTGEFVNEFYGKVEITVENRNFYLKIGPDGIFFDLIPQYENGFVISWLENGFVEIGNLNFIMAEIGEYEEFVIDFIEDEGTGIFKRIK